MKLSTLILAAIPPYAYPGKAFPVGKGCENLASGDTYNCHCKTGQDDMDDDTIVFNQCKLGKERGATHGEAVVDLQGNMGLAVYSGKSTSICGGSERRCKCTCFNEDAVSGSTSTPFQTSTSTKKKNGVTYPGYETYCLGLCGENCNAGFDGPRYASILIHDVCQSYIRSDKPMPNTNDCSDEGYHAAGAAALTTGLGYNCLA